MKSRPSDNYVALESIKKMEEYIKNTPIPKIPINQFKRASRKSICKILDITYSTIGSNAALAELFAELDTSLGFQHKEQKIDESKDLQALRETIGQLQNCIKTLEEENRALRSANNRYNHFISSGRMAR